MRNMRMDNENTARQINSSIPEDITALVSFDSKHDTSEYEKVLNYLQQDKVVLIKNVRSEDADNLVFSVANKLGLSDKLEVQAGFAAIKGHREKVNKYFMSVNKRNDYQFVAAHSEGDCQMNMQMAAFYCLENSTDGGETVLLRTNEDSAMWGLLRETVRKYDLCGRKLSQEEVIQARLMLGVRIPEDILKDDDQILSENEFPVPGIKCFNVLKKLEKSYSQILKKPLYVYWDNVASLDFDGAQEYCDLLKANDLLKEPNKVFGVADYDSANSRRLWHSGLNYDSLFKSKLTRKLKAGDLIFVNNLTWAHSVSNWTPGSGQRIVIGAFA